MNRILLAYLILTPAIILFHSILLVDVDGQSQGSYQNTTIFQHPLPVLKDSNLKIEIVADELYAPTGILFLDKDNMFVLKRYTSGYPLGGNTSVYLLSNGKLREEPVLTVTSGVCDKSNPRPNCSKFNERGLLGIDGRKIDPENSSIAGNFEVFLYYTEITFDGEALGNRVYRYLWDGQYLINPELILDLPALPGPNHNAGKVLIGPDGYLYTIIGDQTIGKKTIPIHQVSPQFDNILQAQGGHLGQVQNIINGNPPDNTSGIFRVNPDNGMAAPDNPFFNINGSSQNLTGGSINYSRAITSDNTTADDNKLNSSSTLSRYFAYGIRNSFGLAFDPVTGNLWDTENGLSDYDEINLVEPGFNSGWTKVMGPIDRINATKVDIKAYGNKTWARLNLSNTAKVTEADLVNFPGSKYSDPEFSWNHTVGVTALGFLDSSKLGDKYENNLFVGDYLYGSLYFFKLNSERNGLEFEKNHEGLSDLVADGNSERLQSVIGNGFDIITDIQTGPDGYLYVVSYTKYSSNHPDNVSRIYRIVPAIQ